jgi:hypothetical protein
MYDYIKQMLSELPSDIDGQAATPAAEHLFKINSENPKSLSSDMSEVLHHNVAKLLFLCKRERPDVQTPVSFLCTRVESQTRMTGRNSDECCVIFAADICH